MTDPAIRVRDLRKTYITFEREAGVGAALKNLVRRRMKETPAGDGGTD